MNFGGLNGFSGQGNVLSEFMEIIFSRILLTVTDVRDQRKMIHGILE
jgi:hypothetical protein